MAQVASTEPGREYKAHVLHQLDLELGSVALDIGCGPGVDLSDLARGVGAAGSVIGVDLDPDMVGAAKRRYADDARIDIRVGDAHDLPLPSDSVDRTRVDRALQHMTAPVDVLAEAHRVTRPGGLVVIAEPDWGTLAIDADDTATSQAFADYTCGVVRNPFIGRQAARLGARVGFDVEEVRLFAAAFRNFTLADQILGLSRNAAAAVADGALDASAAEHWLASLQHGPVLATVVLFVVTLRA